MKKFFTLIAAVAMAASVNAQTTSTEWNFSDWTIESITANKTVNGLTVYANSDKPVAVDKNKKTVDEVDYTQRLKLSGSGAVSDLTALNRVVSFDVTGPCDIYVVAAHASSNGDARTLKFDAIVKGVAENFGEISFDANEYKSGTVKYTGSATTILVYSGKSGINLYDIKVTPSTSTGITSIEASASAKSNAIYNLAGQQVSSSYKGIVIKNGKKVLNNK